MMHTEERTFGNHYRENLLRQLNNIIEQKREEASENRKRYLQFDYSSVERYKESIAKYRA